MPEVNLSGTLAFLTIVGFAAQRTIELLDPLFLAFILKLKTGPPPKPLPWGMSDDAFKKWMTALVSFIFGLIIAPFSEVSLFPPGAVHPILMSALNTLVLALAISTGTNAANSLLKYVEYTKDARKLDLLPVASITITPSTATVRRSSTIQFHALVNALVNSPVTWEVLEAPDGGAIDETTGKYTAPNVAGIYHVAARAETNPPTFGSATITVTAT
jgi:hypothetical protein